MSGVSTARTSSLVRKSMAGPFWARGCGDDVPPPSSCQSAAVAAALPPDDTEGAVPDEVTIAAILEANEAFYRAFNEKDADAMDRIWAESGEVACIHPGWNVLEGREAVMDSWRGILSNPAQ